MQFKNSLHTRSRWFALAGLILILSLVASAEPAQDMQSMPGMSKKSSPQKKRAATRKKKPARKHNMANMPGMNMPEMKMPGMQMPQARPSPGAQPAASPPTQMNMPGMNMPVPQASPSPGAMQNMPGMDNMQGMGSMNMGPLMVMMAKDMGVRVGSRDTNII